MLLERIPILVVDQNRLTRWVFVTRLSELGHRVREADTAARGRDILRSGSHLVVLDPFLPDADGLEFLGEVRRAAPDRPVVVMAASWPVTQRSQLEAVEAGLILDKPADIERVLELVEHCLAQW